MVAATRRKARSKSPAARRPRAKSPAKPQSPSAKDKSSKSKAPSDELSPYEKRMEIGLWFCCVLFVMCSATFLWTGLVTSDMGRLNLCSYSQSLRRSAKVLPNPVANFIQDTLDVADRNAFTFGKSSSEVCSAVAELEMIKNANGGLEDFHWRRGSAITRHSEAKRMLLAENKRVDGDDVSPLANQARNLAHESVATDAAGLRFLEAAAKTARAEAERIIEFGYLFKMSTIEMAAEVASFPNVTGGRFERFSVEAQRRAAAVAAGEDSNAPSAFLRVDALVSALVLTAATGGGVLDDFDTILASLSDLLVGGPVVGVDSVWHSNVASDGCPKNSCSSALSVVHASRLCQAITTCTDHADVTAMLDSFIRPAAKVAAHLVTVALRRLEAEPYAATRSWLDDPLAFLIECARLDSPFPILKVKGNDEGDKAAALGLANIDERVFGGSFISPVRASFFDPQRVNLGETIVPCRYTAPRASDSFGGAGVASVLTIAESGLLKDGSGDKVARCEDFEFSVNIALRVVETLRPKQAARSKVRAAQSDHIVTMVAQGAQRESKKSSPGDEDSRLAGFEHIMVVLLFLGPILAAITTSYVISEHKALESNAEEKNTVGGSTGFVSNEAIMGVSTGFIRHFVQAMDGFEHPVLNLYMTFLSHKIFQQGVLLFFGRGTWQLLIVYASRLFSGLALFRIFALQHRHVLYTLSRSGYLDFTRIADRPNRLPSLAKHQRYIRNDHRRYVFVFVALSIIMVMAAALEANMSYAFFVVDPPAVLASLGCSLDFTLLLICSTDWNDRKQRYDRIGGLTIAVIAFILCNGVYTHAAKSHVDGRGLLLGSGLYERIFTCASSLLALPFTAPMIVCLSIHRDRSNRRLYNKSLPTPLAVPCLRLFSTGKHYAPINTAEDQAAMEHTAVDPNKHIMVGERILGALASFVILGVIFAVSVSITLRSLSDTYLTTCVTLTPCCEVGADVLHKDVIEYGICNGPYEPLSRLDPHSRVIFALVKSPALSDNPYHPAQTGLDVSPPWFDEAQLPKRNVGVGEFMYPMLDEDWEPPLGKHIILDLLFDFLNSQVIFPVVDIDLEWTSVAFARAALAITADLIPKPGLRKAALSHNNSEDLAAYIVPTTERNSTDGDSAISVPDWHAVHVQENTVFGPTSIVDWGSDATFSAFAFVGLGAFSVHRIDAARASSKDEWDMLKHEVPEAHFVSDFSYTASLQVRPGFERYGAIAMFDIDHKPVAIQWSHGGDVVIRPGDDGWEHAKWAYKASVVAGVTLVDHLVGCHLVVSNTITIAMQETLPPRHPIRVLLKPFIFETSKTQRTAMPLLVARGSLVHHATALTYEGMMQGYVFAFDHLPFHSIEHEIKLRGFTERDTPEFWRDAKDFHDVIKRFVQKYIDVFYSDDEAILRDEALGAFVQEVDKEFIRRADKDEVNGRTPKQHLCWILYRSIFHVTGMHNAFGNVGEYFLDPRSAGSKIRPGATQSDIQASFQALFIAMATGNQKPFIGSTFTHLLTHLEGDILEKTVQIFETFQREIHEMGKEVERRNQKRKWPSYMFHPRQVLSSVSV